MKVCWLIRLILSYRVHANIRGSLYLVEREGRDEGSYKNLSIFIFKGPFNELLSVEKQMMVYNLTVS